MTGREDTGTNAKRKLERELRLGMMTSRRSMLDRDRAMEAARNPGVSKFGDCLVNINTKADKLLTSQLRKLRAEMRQMELQMSQKKKHFVKTSGVLNHDPLILVERPASPENIKRAQVINSLYERDELPLVEDGHVPGYMKPLRSRVRTPSTLCTIDAFTVKVKRKRNTWEEALDEKSTPEFQSTVRPSAKLTSREKSDLQVGYNYHKPRLTPETRLSPESTTENNRKNMTKRLTTASEGEESGAESELEEFTPFITQMATVRQKRKSKTPDSDKGRPLSLPDANTSIPLPEMTSLPVPDSTLHSGKGSVTSQGHGANNHTTKIRNRKNVRFASPGIRSPALKGKIVRTQTTLIPV